MAELCRTLAEMDRGLLGNRLGADIFKKRLPLPGRGKRSGARVILVYRKADLAIFLEGYAKNDKDDLSPREEEALRIFAKAVLELSEAELRAREWEGALVPLIESEQ